MRALPCSPDWPLTIQPRGPYHHKHEHRQQTDDVAPGRLPAQSVVSDSSGLPVMTDRSTRATRRDRSGLLTKEDEPTGGTFHSPAGNSRACHDCVARRREGRLGAQRRAQHRRWLARELNAHAHAPAPDVDRFRRAVNPTLAEHGPLPAVDAEWEIVGLPAGYERDITRWRNINGEQVQPLVVPVPVSEVRPCFVRVERHEVVPALARAPSVTEYQWKFGPNTRASCTSSPRLKASKKFTSSAAASPGWQPGHGSSFRIAWRAALTLFAPGTAGAKTMLRRSFEPVPPETFYASVWAGVESMMTLRCPRAAA